MELYLIRHGEAETGNPDEEGPPLSERGMGEVRRVVDHLGTLKKFPSRVFSSTLRRAFQTAELFNQNWQLEIAQVEWLAPGVEPSRIIKELSQIPDPSVALVGHLPTLGWLLSTLLWGVPPKEIILPKGSVSYLEVQAMEPAGATLRWMISPEMILE